MMQVNNLLIIIKSCKKYTTTKNSYNWKQIFLRNNIFDGIHKYSQQSSPTLIGVFLIKILINKLLQGLKKTIFWVVYTQYSWFGTNSIFEKYEKYENVSCHIQEMTCSKCVYRARVYTYLFIFFLTFYAHVTMSPRYSLL